MANLSNLILGTTGLTLATTSIMLLSIVYAPSPVRWAQPTNSSWRVVELCRFALYGFIAVLGLFGGSIALQIKQNRRLTPRLISALTVFSIHCVLAIVALSVDAYVEIRSSRDARIALPEDLKFAMYQYMIDDETRPSVDSLHSEMNCCGVNNVSDWSSMTIGAQMFDNPVEATRAYVPRSCCAHERAGRCTKFRTKGCYPALMNAIQCSIYFLQVRLPAVFYPDVILGCVLYMLALGARVAQRR
ncbi:tetraspanin-7-like isoform X2 [Varroa jacobsoni]|uniref:Tetraspanin n=1 Tax=Varroa destructor TaxID=109461 RepID=A0A7M7JWP9_VARDE|nr:tetraspanin-7-like isoform X2 [Varroa destructor]XP_022692849.1 tetraspanin-7-like isoform X2 [Varroa jacobsoni]